MEGGEVVSWKSGKIFTKKTTTASAERWVKVEEDGKAEKVEGVKKAGMVGEVK